MSPHDHFWDFIVDFGDLAAIGPAVGAGCAVLWARRHRLPVLAWTGSFAACIATVAALKAAHGLAPGIVGLGCGAAPSGHTAMSFAFYGALAALLLRALGGWRGAVAVAAAMLPGAMVAAATLELRWHGWIDVAEDMALGGASALATWRSLRGTFRPVDGVLPAAAALVVLTALHGTRLDTGFDAAGAPCRQITERSPPFGPPP